MNSQSEPVVEYRQSIAAILIYYVISFKFMLAMFTGGIVAILDYLNYKNTKLVFEPIFWFLSLVRLRLTVKRSLMRILKQ